MAKKKVNPWEAISAKEQLEAAKKAKEQALKKLHPEAEQSSSRRKMLRIGDEEHAMVKKAAAWLEMGMQEYVEMLIRNSFEQLFPDEK